MIRPGLALQLTRAVPRRFASTAAAGENEFVAKRLAMKEHAVRAFTISTPGRLGLSGVIADV